MFRNLTSQLSAGENGAEAKKVMAPTLRTDIYSAIDKTKSWMIGGLGCGQAGDGVSYGTMLAMIQKHFPEMKLGLESVGSTEGEVAVVVGGITNMIMELSKWEGMAGGMAMRTWVDSLIEAHGRAASAGSRKDSIAKGITRGMNQNTDVTLLTREFTTRIQIISCLKTVSSRIYGSGTDEARQAEAMWSSKFI